MTRTQIQRTGIDGSGDGTAITHDEWKDVESVYTQYDQYASNDHLPPGVDTPYGLDTAVIGANDATAGHPHRPAPGPHAAQHAIDTLINVPIHERAERGLTSIASPAKLWMRAAKLAYPGGPAPYAPTLLAAEDPQREVVLIRGDDSGANPPPVWISTEEPNPSAMPGPNMWPVWGFDVFQLATTSEIWAMADPAATAPVSIFIMTTSRR